MYRVFLVDDEPWALIALQGIVDWNHLNYEICGVAEDGETALQSIQQLQPDLVLSDIRMPGLSGLELLEELRLQGLDTRLVFISGYSEFEYARTALRYGASGYLLKPVEEAELVEVLGRVHKELREREARKQTYPNPDADTSNAAAEDSPEERDVIADIVSYIHLHYAEPISLQLLADVFNLNDTYISSQIRKKTGKKFGDHLVESRIAKAKELLLTTGLSIEDVSLKTGYPDPYYFSKVFKKNVGISPAAFRKGN